MLVPDRLREPVPRLAGDVAALPLPVAGEGEPPLVDLLRGDEAADAAGPSTGSRSTRSPRRAGLLASKLAAYAAIAGSASRPTRSRSSARSTSPTSTRSRGSSSAPTARRTPSARRSPRCSRRTRSSSSPSCSGAASRSGGPRTRRRRALIRRARHEGADDLVLGAGRARRHARALGPLRHARPAVPDRRRRRRGDRALPPDRRARCAARRRADQGLLVRQRRRAGAARRRRRRPPSHSLQNQFHQYVRHEVVPAIRSDCKSADIEIVGAGASIGAFHAVAVLCRFPDVFRAAVCMSGTYDLARFFDGPADDDFSSRRRCTSCPAWTRTAPLRRLRTRFILLASGQGAPRTRRVVEGGQRARSRGVPNRVDSGGRSGPTTG